MYLNRGEAVALPRFDLQRLTDMPSCKAPPQLTNLFQPASRLAKKYVARRQHDVLRLRCGVGCERDIAHPTYLAGVLPTYTFYQYSDRDREAGKNTRAPYTHPFRHGKHSVRIQAHAYLDIYTSYDVIRDGEAKRKHINLGPCIFRTHMQGWVWGGGRGGARGCEEPACSVGLRRLSAPIHP